LNVEGHKKTARFAALKRTIRRLAIAVKQSACSAYAAPPACNATLEILVGGDWVVLGQARVRRDGLTRVCCVHVVHVRPLAPSWTAMGC